ncbi:hypothetical protein L195_g001142 [Trifolium pratense]|uniref:Uncharacterized protein n=1 Tax=Trifolium pratense TaxID=57577 RepID=A0A2K3NNV4_TRIPR|nr:hypothetical protein L195_g001142 [Trifolium pratense]
MTRDLLVAITLVVNLWLGGRCPKSFSEFVASAYLTPLLKPDGGIRHIVVGTIWRVEISNGAEVILHSVNRVLSQQYGDGSSAMLTINFLNALNMVDRSTLLCEVWCDIGVAVVVLGVLWTVPCVLDGVVVAATDLSWSAGGCDGYELRGCGGVGSGVAGVWLMPCVSLYLFGLSTSVLTVLLAGCEPRLVYLVFMLPFDHLILALGAASWIPMDRSLLIRNRELESSSIFVGRVDVFFGGLETMECPLALDLV